MMCITEMRSDEATPSWQTSYFYNEFEWRAGKGCSGKLSVPDLFVFDYLWSPERLDWDCERNDALILAPKKMDESQTFVCLQSIHIRRGLVANNDSVWESMKGRVLQWDKWWDGLCQSTCHFASESLSSAHWSYQPPHSLPGSGGIDCTAQSCCLQPPYCINALRGTSYICMRGAQPDPCLTLKSWDFSHFKKPLFVFSVYSSLRGMVGWRKADCGTARLGQYLHFSFFL